MSDERDGGSFSGAVGRRCTDAFLAARCSKVDVTQGSQRQRAEEAVPGWELVTSSRGGGVYTGRS